MFKKDIKLFRKNNTSDLTRMIKIADLEAIDVETPRIDSGCSLENEFNELIPINP